MSKKWMITGANGNLGRKLVSELCLNGEEVIAVCGLRALPRPSGNP